MKHAIGLALRVSLWATLLMGRPRGADLHARADSARVANDFITAQRLYRQALQLQPDNEELQFRHAQVLAYQGKYREAMRLYERLIESSPDNIDALLGYAQTAWMRGLPYTARAHFRQVCAKEPDTPRAGEMLTRLARISRFHLFASAKLAYELEEQVTYTESRLPLQEYRLSKRLSDHVELQAGMLFDRSARWYRSEDGAVDTLLEQHAFNNFYTRLILHLGKQRLFMHTGFSESERTWTGLTLAWHAPIPLGKLLLTHSLEGGFEYFNYWSESIRDFVAENARVRFSRFTLHLRLMGARVRPQMVFDLPHGQRARGDTLLHERQNLYLATREKLRISILTAPVLDLFVAHRYEHYEMGSLSYYTPHHRHQASAGAHLGLAPRHLRLGLTGEGGYDDGGELMDGSDAEDGFFGQTRLEGGLAWDNFNLTLGYTFFVNPRYRSQVIDLRINL